jgi:exodeoxyribonuclease VII large subunit
MSTLFDLPFEEPEPDPEPPTRPERRGRETEPDPAPSVPAPGAPSIHRRVDPAPRRVLTVAQLTARIRTLLEETFFEVWVEGEISNCRIPGHMYFTLKGAGAQIKGVMFRSALQRLRFKPQDGLRVVARARISVYDPKGEYQIVCEHLEPEGLGARQLAFDQLKQRLAAEGLFDPRRKRPLPALPRKIGIVTSLDGAAVRDIIKVLRSRYVNAHIVVRPTRVQGDGAEMDIARGLAAIGKVPGVDVVIVGRGGGSIEDLWAFNEEVVARAIAGCPVPTIAAVGHETDVTIADFVADVRAATPSAAAEMVVARKDEFGARIDRLSQRVAGAMRGRLHRAEARLRSLEARPGYAGAPGRLVMRGRHAAELTHELRRGMRAQVAARERHYQTLRLTLETFDLRRRLGGVRTRLVGAEGRLSAAMDRRRHAADARLRGSAARLDSLSPLAVLGRGYAVCWTADKSAVIRDAASVATGDRVCVTLERGELECEVLADGSTGRRAADDSPPTETPGADQRAARSRHREDTPRDGSDH